MTHQALQIDRKPAHLRWCILSCAICLLAIAGCGKESPTLGIAEIEQGRIQERLVEVELGQFTIPVPAAYTTDDKEVHYRTFLMLRFNLWALVSPRQQSHTKRLLERHKGTLRDRVMTVCRLAPLTDLQDPNLTALRSRLLDELQPLFEGNLLKRIGVNDVLTDPL